MFRFILFSGVIAALAVVLWWSYPTFRGLPSGRPLETKCKAVRERADIQEGLSMLHGIDESLAKLDADYAAIKKMDTDTPVYLRDAERGIEERQRHLSNKKTNLLGGVPCLADVYNAEQVR